MLPKFVIDLDYTCKSASELLAHAASLAKANNFVDDEQNFYNCLQAREQEITTALGKGVAFPHGRIKQGIENFIIIIRLKKAIDFNALDSQLVNLFFVLGSKHNEHKFHLKMLQRIAKGLMQPSLKTVFKNGDKDEITVLFTKLFNPNIILKNCSNILYNSLLSKNLPYNFYLENQNESFIQTIADGIIDCFQHDSLDKVITQIKELQLSN